MAVPAYHHVLVLSPDFHAVARDEFFPVLRHLGLRVQQSDRDVARQVFDRADVDLGVERRGTHAAGPGEIGHAIGEQDDVERSKHEVLPLDVHRGPLEERVEVGDGIVLREPRAEIRLDLRRRLPPEVLDRVEALRLSDMLAAERTHEHVGGLLQTAQPVDVSVDVQRRVAHRIIELAALAERAGDVESDDERGTRRGRVRRRFAADEPEGEQPHYGALHRATSPLTRAGKCVAANTSSMDLNGSVKWPRPVNTTNRKFIPDATTWSTGSDASSNSSRDSLRNHSSSALRALMGPFQ